MSTPYTYLIGWKALDRWYYGVRFAKNAKPIDLWKTYFTSSRSVRDFVKVNGDPDVIEIRKTFSSIDAARTHEVKVIRRLGCVMDDKWLNRANARSIHPIDCAKHTKGKTYEEIHGEEKARILRASRSKSNSERHVSGATRFKMSEKKKGKPREADARKQTSDTLKKRYADPSNLLDLRIARNDETFCLISMCMICGKFQRSLTDFCSKTCSNRNRTQEKKFIQERKAWAHLSTTLYSEIDLERIGRKLRSSKQGRILEKMISEQFP